MRQLVNLSKWAVLFSITSNLFVAPLAYARAEKYISITAGMYENSEGGLICAIVNKTYHRIHEMRCSAIIGSADPRDYDANFEKIPLSAKAPDNMRALFYFSNEKLRQDYAIVTEDTTDEEIVYKVTKAVYEEFFHYSNVVKISKKELTNVGDIPLHPGALKFFKEVGLK